MRFLLLTTLLSVATLLSLAVLTSSQSARAQLFAQHHHGRATRLPEAEQPVRVLPTSSALTADSDSAAAVPRLTVNFPPLLSPTNGSSSNYTHCDLCTSLTQYISVLVQNSYTLKVLELMAFFYCLNTENGKDCHGYQSCSELCWGVIGEFAPILIPILANTSLSAQDICFDLSLCPDPTPPGPPVPGVPVPANVSDLTGQKKWPMWGTTTGTGTFLHITDMHYDRLYQEGAKTDCPLDLCCRAEDTGQGSAGLFGDYKCDSPQLLLSTLFDYLNSSLSPRPDFILYTGDDPAHDIWEQTYAKNLDSIAFVSSELLRFFPDIPVFNAIGNHEACPVNIFAGPGKDSWLYEQLALDWSYYLPQQAQRTLNFGGYYATLLRPGLYVVSINSNIYAADDDYVNPSDPQDLSGQLPWLNHSLYQIQQLKAQAIIIGHSSPVHWYPAFISAFNSLLELYNNTIVNLFWGHTHHNQVQLYHPSSSAVSAVPFAVGYIAGSITPYTDTNPGFSVYSYDRSLSSPFLVSDIAYHWINLTEANSQRSIDWSPVRISAMADYALPSLSPLDWYKLAESLRMNGSAAIYEKMRLVDNKGLYDGGEGTEKERKGFACEMENDSDAASYQCAKETGVEGWRRKLGRDREDQKLFMDCSGSSRTVASARAKWLPLERQ